MAVHHIPITLLLQYQDNPNYSFSYNVADEHTGDIKNQQESRIGDTVTGHYSLVQPDGVRRVVDYSADDLRGFSATVNNERPNGNGNGLRDDGRVVDFGSSGQDQWPQNPNVSPASIAISSSSIVHSITNGHPVPNSWV